MTRVRFAALGDVCTFTGGGTPSRNQPDYFAGEIPWATVKDFKNFTIESTKEHITEQAVRDSATNIVERGTVLLVTRVGLGKVAVTGTRLAINQDIKAVQPNTDLDPQFLFWFLVSQAGRIQAMGTGATVKGVTLNDVKTIRCPVPSLIEQRRIVDRLNRAEGIVRLRREAQCKAAELIPAIFLGLFGDPATNSKRWSIVPVSELLAEPPVLGTMAKPSTETARWLDLRVANIQAGQLALDDKKWIDLPEDQIERFSLHDGDILLARAIGSLDHLGKAIIVRPEGDWTFDSHLMRVRLNHNKLLPIVFKTFLESDGGRKEFLKYTRRSAVQFNINGKELRKIRIPLPPIDLQRQFAAKAEAVRSIITRQTAALATAQATFDALLHRAFAN